MLHKVKRQVTGKAKIDSGVTEDYIDRRILQTPTIPNAKHYNKLETFM